MSETDTVTAINSSNDENIQNEKSAKGRRTKNKAIERFMEESEAITKDLAPEVEGRRRTRSSVKGVSATPPPPAKKEKKTPATALASGKAKGRGRPKKNIAGDEEGNEQLSKNDATEMEAEEPSKEPEKTQDDSDRGVENHSHGDEKKEPANNNTGDAKAKETTENGEKSDDGEVIDAKTEKEAEKHTAAEKKSTPEPANDSKAEVDGKAE